MSPPLLYSHRSMILLDEETQQVLASWERKIHQTSTPVISSYALTLALENRMMLRIMIDEIHQELRAYDVALLPFLTPWRRDYLRQRLLRAHYLNALQIKIDTIEYRSESRKKCQKNCDQCQLLLKRMQETVTDQPSSYASSLDYYDRSKLSRWFGLRILVPIMGSLLIALSEGKINLIRKYLNRSDREYRYLGWSKAFILSFFNLCHELITQYPNYLMAIKNSSFYLSEMNQIMISSMLGLEIFCLLKNTILTPYHTRHQFFKVNMTDQCEIQWRMRRWSILNYAFSSLFYMMSMFVLSDINQIWPWSIVLTVSFRLIALILLIYRYRDESEAMEARLSQYLVEIEALNLKKERLMEMRELDLEHKLMLQTITEAILKLNELYDQERRLNYLRRQEISRQVLFTMAILIGTIMLALAFSGLTIMVPPVNIVIGFIGATFFLSSLLGIAYLKGNATIQKTSEHILSLDRGGAFVGKSTLADRLMEKDFEQFKALKAMPQSEARDQEMKYLYLQMQHRCHVSSMHLKKAEHESAKLWAELSTQIFSPVAVVVFMLLLPMPFGWIGIIGVLALAFAVKKIVASWGPSSEIETMVFQDEAYEAFRNNPSIDRLVNASSRSMNANVEEESPNNGYWSPPGENAGH